MIISWLLGVFLVALATSVGLVIIKLGTNHLQTKGSLVTLLTKNYRLLLGVLIYFVASIFFIYILQERELSVIYPVATALSYLFVTLLSVEILREQITLNKVLGLCSIIVGVIFMVV